MRHLTETEKNTLISLNSMKKIEDYFNQKIWHYFKGEPGYKYEDILKTFTLFVLDIQTQLLDECKNETIQ